MLIHNAIILTMNDTREVITDGALLYKGEKIIDVGKSATLLKKYKDEEKIDAKGRILMPGLVNCHTHLYSTFACGISLKSKAPKNFPEILQKLWWRLDNALSKDSVRLSAIIPLISAIRLGSTTLIDHHSSPMAVKGSLSTIADCFEQMGLRGVLSYEVSDRNGEKNSQDGIAENISFLEELKQCKRNKNMLGGLFGLHASFTLKDKTLSKCYEAAKGYNTGFHIHLAEDLADRVITEKKFKTKIVKRLLENGILGEKTFAAHCIHLTPDEMDILAKTKTIAIHNPRSNMNNAVGRMKIETLLKKKIRICLGTDGMSSGMWDELKTAFLIHKHDLKNPNYGWDDFFKILFYNNPEIAGKILNIKLGVLEKGAAADMIILDYLPSTPINSSNLNGHIYFKIAESPVDTTIVNGKILMKNKIITVIDEEKICSEALKTSKKVWDNF